MLIDTSLSPVRWVIPGILPPGLTVLAGTPKLGKSWLMLDIAIAVARGTPVLGMAKGGEAGDVLYLALEDNDRRLQQRLRKLTDTSEGLERLGFWNLLDNIPSLDQGTLGWISEWIDEQPNPKLVIVDTLARVRPGPVRGQSAYQADYEAVGMLQRLAAEKGIAIVVVTHTRKASASDPFDCVSGTLGISGAADATMVMRRKGEFGPVTLYARGRDIEESEQAITFDRDTCRWTVTGDARRDDRTDGSVSNLSPERAAILTALDLSEVPLSAAEVSAATGMPGPNVRRLLSRMAATGEVVKAGRGRYGRVGPHGPDAPNRGRVRFRH